RRGTDVGASGGRVRRHHRLRRQPGRHHPNDTAAGLPGHRIRQRRHRPGPFVGPADRLSPGAGRAAGPLARKRVSLAATVGLTLGDLGLDVTLDVDETTTVAIVGPNGAGKTTLLRALAGLVPLTRGR